MIYTQLSWREETMAQFVAEHFGTPMPGDFDYQHDLDVDWCGYVHIVANAAALFADLVTVARCGDISPSDGWYDLLEAVTTEFRNRLLEETTTLCCRDLEGPFRTLIDQNY